MERQLASFYWIVALKVEDFYTQPLPKRYLLSPYDNHYRVKWDYWLTIISLCNPSVMRLRQ